MFKVGDYLTHIDKRIKYEFPFCVIGINGKHYMLKVFDKSRGRDETISWDKEIAHRVFEKTFVPVIRDLFELKENVS